MSPPKQGSPIQKIDTLLNADTVEWCPFLGHEMFLLCGTYKLKESSAQSPKNDQTTLEDTESPASCEQQPQVREGGVTVYQMNGHLNEQPTLQTFTSVDMSGVLDIKWPNGLMDNKLVCGLVDSEGYIQILHLDVDRKCLHPLTKHMLIESSLGLSLDWSHNNQNPSCLAASDSAGFLTVFEVRNEQLSQTASWKAHDYEAWITAFHNTDSNILYSGGDDCRLKRWDLRDTSNPTMTSRRHQMGVCSIQSHPLKENIFASGSYDEEVCVWDDRQLKRPLTSTTLGGGVWRIKWEPQTGCHILTATMYNGTHIVDCSDFGTDPLPIVAVYEDHNLAYGADWCRWRPDSSHHTTDPVAQDSKMGKNHHNSFLIATCSFYDHALHLWSWDANNT